MIFRAVLSGHMYGQLVQNVLHFNKTQATWPADATGLCAAIRDSWLGGTNGIKNMQTQDCVWSKIQVYQAGNTSFMPVELVINIQGFDSNGATQIMSFASYILRIRSTVGGRHGRGRVYIPAPRFGNYINGILTASAITAWNPVLTQLASAFLGANPTTGFNLWISPSPDNNVDGYACEGLSLASTAGVQRRRNVGVGV